MTAPYVTVDYANTYFSTRLHVSDWLNANTSDQTAAILMASERLQALNWNGVKHSIWLLYVNNIDPGHTLIQAANVAQDCAFPRGPDTVIPTDIMNACCEIAIKFLEPDYDADLEYETLNMRNAAYSSAGGTFESARARQHLLAGIPSITAWRLLRPYLADDRGINLRRVI